jgi:hypothetical protein
MDTIEAPQAWIANNPAGPMEGGHHRTLTQYEVSTSLIY